MKIKNIIDLVNHKLAGELLTLDELLMHMDGTIDDINAQMNTKFPSFSEVVASSATSDPEYDMFPDKYIRSVVVTGTAFKYYTVDEEGGFSSPKFEQDYMKALFMMLRDYILKVPEEYKETEQGYDYDSDGEARGLYVRQNPIN